MEAYYNGKAVFPMQKKISYNPLWKTLIDKGIKNKTDLIKIANISSGTLSKLNKNMEVSTKIITRIATSLQIDDLTQIAEISEE